LSARPITCLAAVVLMCRATVAVAQPPANDRSGVTWTPTPFTTLRLFPAEELYEPYVADPHHPSNVLAANFYTRKEIPQSRSPRTTLGGGGRFGVFRTESSRPGGRWWQVSIDAGLDALFDSNYKNDSVGWDGNYGLTVTTASNGSRLAYKIALLHVSAHLGDEYEERTERTRINYTREELALGTSWRFAPHWRTYGEVGVAYIVRSPDQERPRWEAGLEYEGARTLFGGRMAWYGGADLSGMAERDWRLDTALQGGIVTRTGGRAYRLYLQYHDGRVPLGQFFMFSEASVSLGLRMDL
jgi:Protein of unknown function (DUF1207)